MMINICRKYCLSFTNGEFDDVSNNNALFLTNFFDLLLNYKFLFEEVRLYLSEPSFSYTDVTNICKINYNTFKTRIRSDNKLIEKIFGEFLNTIFSGDIITDNNLKRAIMLINFNKEKYGNRNLNLNDYLVVPVEYMYDENISIDDEAFEILSKELLDISKSLAKMRVKYLTNEFKLYFNKLNYGKDLSEVDILRKEDLINKLTRSF